NVANKFGATVEILHLLDTDKDTGQVLQSFSRYSEHLRAAYPNTEFTDSVIATFSVVDTLENLHTHIPYDMLVMVRHEKSLAERLYMQSCTRHMAYLTLKPLMIIPA